MPLGSCISSSSMVSMSLSSLMSPSSILSYPDERLRKRVELVGLLRPCIGEDAVYNIGKSIDVLRDIVQRVE